METLVAERPAVFRSAPREVLEFSEISLTGGPDEPSRVILHIMALASNTVKFAPRALTYLRSHPEELVRLHCDLLVKCGKLRRMQNGAERWYALKRIGRIRLI